MGDHRASIIVKFEMHGVKEKCDMWINYYPDESCGYEVDRRVLEFFDAAYKKAMVAYFDDQYDASLIRDADKEKLEREELSRLKQKYETVAE